jgi:purine-binding chemotaxis protein CheW
MLSEAEIEPTPEFGTSINTEYIVGMAKVKGQVKMLLDIDRVVSTDAMRGMTQAL